jgi:hypothetical protein
MCQDLQVRLGRDPKFFSFPKSQDGIKGKEFNDITITRALSMDTAKFQTMHVKKYFEPWYDH